MPNPAQGPRGYGPLALHKAQDSAVHTGMRMHGQPRHQVEMASAHPWRNCEHASMDSSKAKRGELYNRGVAGDCGSSF